jgi:hypothetical protein
MATKFFLNGTIKLPASKCQRPSFKNHRGRGWDNGSILIDGVKYSAYLDTVWGFFIYFQFGEGLQWHKVKMFSDGTQDIRFPEKSYHIDPFKVPPEQITTKK